MSIIQHLLFTGAALFCIGLLIVIIKKNAIMILLGIELMLNACNLNLIAFNRIYTDKLDGQMFALFVIVVAVCEAAVGLAIVLSVYKYYTTVVPSQLDEIKES